MGQEEEAVLVPAAAVVFSLEPVVKKTAAAAEARRDVPPGSPKKVPQPPVRRLSVPPPPGRASVPAPATRSLSSMRRAVRPEDDPFLAAYLACTKSSGRRGGKDAGGAPREEAKGRRRFTWAGLGLSCKSSAGAVEQSMVKVAERPELNPRDD
ncbi:hypothetical protein BAE44_0023365 [Dichanthelium oligosanthes]|uniref:Uncharacterized protein n=1 Tax=Dichanthelium oligosanthes TaxID=888268 RepID=A0A1E5URV8_9POAL|nr:hypothetical protein BAE44_0023365 [Dichanthelium oligosanthes]